MFQDNLGDFPLSQNSFGVKDFDSD